MKMRYQIVSWEDGRVLAEPEIYAFDGTPDTLKLGLAIAAVRAEAIAAGTTPIFWGADLRDANLMCENLSFCDFSMADLSGAYLRGADLTGCDFRNADLVDADLYLAKLDGAKFKGADLRGAILPTDVHRHSLSGAKISQAQPYRKTAA